MTLSGNVLLASGCHGNGDLATSYKVLLQTSEYQLTPVPHSTLHTPSYLLVKGTTLVFTYFDSWIREILA